MPEVIGEILPLIPSIPIGLIVEFRSDSQRRML